MSRTTRALQLAAELSARCDRQARRIRELTEAVVAGDAQLRTAEAELADLRENRSQEAADHAEDAQMIAGLTEARDRETAERKQAVRVLAATITDRDLIKAQADESQHRFAVACNILGNVARGANCQIAAEAFIVGKKLTEGGLP